jgi:hypothetical protein
MHFAYCCFFLAVLRWVGMTNHWMSVPEKRKTAGLRYSNSTSSAGQSWSQVSFVTRGVAIQTVAVRTSHPQVLEHL